MNRRFASSSLLLAILAASLSACADSADEPIAAASSEAANLAVVGPDTVIHTESAQDRADRLNAMQDAPEPQLDANGDPIEASENMPTREEMERAVAKAEEEARTR